MDNDVIDVQFSHISATRKFSGWLGPLWTIIHCYIQKRQDIKYLSACLKLREAGNKSYALEQEAERLRQAQEFEQEKQAAMTIAGEIRKNCAADVHEVEKWRKGSSWSSTNKISGNLMSEWTNMHGICKHCGSPVDKRHYTLPPDRI